MRTAAFFDLDGTLLRGESQFSFLIWMLMRGRLPVFRTLFIAARYAGYVAGLSQDAERLRQGGFSIVKGLSLAELERQGGLFLGSRLPKQLRRYARSVVQMHRDRGDLTVLVTSACAVVARPAAEHLPIQALLASRLLVVNGICTGECASPSPYGLGKKQVVEQFCQDQDIVPEESFAYADHPSDISLLEYVGRPVVTNPTLGMRDIAQRRKWPVADLETGAGLHGLAHLDMERVGS